jgi:type IV secretory pathway VirB10-like protein
MSASGRDDDIDRTGGWHGDGPGSDPDFSIDSLVDPGTYRDASAGGSLHGGASSHWQPGARAGDRPMRRDLHWWIGGALLAVALPMLLWQALDEERTGTGTAASRQTGQDRAPVRPPESSSALERTIDEQARQAGWQAAQPSPGWPPLPGLPPSAAGPAASASPLPGTRARASDTVAEALRRDERTDTVLPGADPLPTRAERLAAEEERRIADARSSPLLAIGQGGGASAFPVPQGDGGGPTPPERLAPFGGGPTAIPESVPAGTRAAIAADSAMTMGAGAAMPATAPAQSVLRRAPGGPALLEGTVIPAVLLTAINSDLPGTLVAQVTQDIWDSVHGRYLLVPKGTRLVGDYNADVRPGQERVLAAFRRLILPNGSSVDLLGTQATDAQGRSGLHDRVDRHFAEMFGASFIVAGLAALVPRRAPQPATVIVLPGSAAGASSALASAAGSVLVETSRAILGRAQNIPPTLLIRQGHRFSLTVQRTFLLAPEDAVTIPDVAR